VSIVGFVPEALDELAEAAAWYLSHRPGLDVDFLAEVERVLPLIERTPKRFPSLTGLPRDLKVRRALLPRFPYAVIFMEISKEIRILAVAHAKREPGYWLDRVAG
jgi:hypothetical protein